jgi:hypothetical protein
LLVRLPNSDRSVVDDAKVRDYLLSPSHASHPVGPFKSVFFAALGFSQADWQALRDALLELASSDAATPRHAWTAKRIRAEVQGPC